MSLLNKPTTIYEPYYWTLERNKVILYQIAFQRKQLRNFHHF